MSNIIGQDETGYGSLVGSLIVGGVRAPAAWSLDGLRDSKKLSFKRRQQLREQLLELVDKQEITFYLAERTHTYIDEVGVYRALKEAHVEVMRMLWQEGDQIIVDGNLKFKDMGADHMNWCSVIKADDTVPQVMAAAILSKTHRDSMLIKLSKQYPQYEWNKNMGYPNPFHLRAIQEHGITPYHRMSYRPMKEMISIKWHNSIRGDNNEDDNK